MAPRSLPRLPARKRNRNQQFNSSRLWLQHKASCYRGHVYSNRSNSLQECTTVQLARWDLQVGVHLVRECPTEAIRHAEAHPTAHQRGPRRSTVICARASWALPSRTPGRCAPSGSSAAARSDPTTMLKLDVFQSFRTRPQRGGPTPKPHVKVVRTSLCGLSSHPPERRCLLCRPTNSCGYQQGEPSPYLVSRLLRRARLSHNRKSFGHEQYQARRTPVEYT